MKFFTKNRLFQDVQKHCDTRDEYAFYLHIE